MNNLRIGWVPAAVSLIAIESATPFIVPEQTNPPGRASTSTPKAGDFRISGGSSSGATGRSLTVESPPLPWIRRARTTTPALLRERSRVSKKSTCRIWASSGSRSRAATADRRLESGTVSFSSTLSAFLISWRSSASCSSVRRFSLDLVAVMVGFLPQRVWWRVQSWARIEPKGTGRRHGRWRRPAPRRSHRRCPRPVARR